MHVTGAWCPRAMHQVHTGACTWWRSWHQPSACRMTHEPAPWMRAVPARGSLIRICEPRAAHTSTAKHSEHPANASQRCTKWNMTKMKNMLLKGWEFVIKWNEERVTKWSGHEVKTKSGMVIQKIKQMNRSQTRRTNHAHFFTGWTWW